MPRFYFDIHDRDGTFRDNEGLELPDATAAELMARKTLAGLIKDALSTPGEDNLAIVIRDDVEGPIVIRVTLETVPLDDKEPR